MHQSWQGTGHLPRSTPLSTLKRVLSALVSNLQNSSMISKFKEIVTQSCSIYLRYSWLTRHWCLQIFPQIAKPASSFTDEEGLELLLGPEYKQANKQPFPMAEINKSALLNDGVNQATGLQTDEDLLNHLGIDLALRCLCIEPCALAKEYPKREFISPVLYAASILSGISAW